jgi:hypothetical protein
LHVPAIALSEAHKVIRGLSPRVDLDRIKAFVRDQRNNSTLDDSSATVVVEVLSKFQQHVESEKREAPRRVAGLLQEPVIDIFALDEQSLIRSTAIAAETGLGLQSFDLSILAAVLVRGAVLHAAGEEVSFCTLDADLQPWDKKGVRKQELADLFDRAGVWVYRDFVLTAPERTGAWPGP